MRMRQTKLMWILPGGESVEMAEWMPRTNKEDCAMLLKAAQVLCGKNRPKINYSKLSYEHEDGQILQIKERFV